MSSAEKGVTRAFGSRSGGPIMRALRGFVGCCAAALAAHTALIPTVPGARTSFFAPEIDCLLLAVLATAREPAAIWLLRPGP